MVTVESICFHINLPKLDFLKSKMHRKDICTEINTHLIIFRVQKSKNHCDHQSIVVDISWWPFRNRWNCSNVANEYNKTTEYIETIEFKKKTWHFFSDVCNQIFINNMKKVTDHLWSKYKLYKNQNKNKRFFLSRMGIISRN